MSWLGLYQHRTTLPISPDHNTHVTRPTHPHLSPVPRWTSALFKFLCLSVSLSSLCCCVTVPSLATIFCFCYAHHCVFVPSTLRNYSLHFCEYLTEGVYSVVHISQHGNFFRTEEYTAQTWQAAFLLLLVMRKLFPYCCHNVTDNMNKLALQASTDATITG